METHIIGILRNILMEDLESILAAYADAGLTALEITMNTPRATEMISHAYSKFDQLIVGAGTVCTMQDLDKALAAGAQFVVTPIVQEEVIKTCVQEQIPIFPGAMTPTEIAKAWSLGATMVKVFPAGILGPSYIKTILDPLNDVKILATGGIDLNNMEEYRAAGVHGFGIGGSLFPSSMIKEKNWLALINHIRQYALKTGVLGTEGRSHG